MTKNKFKETCEQVLLPGLSEILTSQFKDQQEILGAILQEIMRVGDAVEALAHIDAAEDRGDL